MVQLRARVGMVFQKPNPFPVDLRQHRLRTASTASPARKPISIDRQILAPAGLWDEVKRIALRDSGTALSGGQQQRLCIGRAILSPRPEVILMDEPPRALDPIATTPDRELIHELRGRYAIVITHNAAGCACRSAPLSFTSAMVEYGPTYPRDFRNPANRARIYHRPPGGPFTTGGLNNAEQHTVKAFDDDINKAS